MYILEQCLTHLLRVLDVLCSTDYISWINVRKTMINIVIGGFLTSVQPDVLQIFTVCITCDIVSNCVVSIEWMDDIGNWKGCGRKQFRPNVRCYPIICLEIHENLSYSQCHGKD
jgi:hypothetical protein